MFCLNIALGSTSWRLLFRDEDTSKIAISALQAQTAEAAIRIVDDFGQDFCGFSKSIHGFMLEDLDKTKMAHVEMALHQERTRVMATKAAQTDPALRAGMAGTSPAIINPMGNGRGPF